MSGTGEVYHCSSLRVSSDKPDVELDTLSKLSNLNCNLRHNLIRLFQCAENEVLNQSCLWFISLAEDRSALLL